MSERDTSKDRSADDKAAAQFGPNQAPSPEADPWASAPAAGTDDSGLLEGGTGIFHPLDPSQSKPVHRDLDVVMDIPVKLTVELGRTRVTIKHLLELTQGSIVELDSLAGEPMDILINGYLIAQGEVVVVDDRHGIRITEIITPSERMQKLNR